MGDFLSVLLQHEFVPYINKPTHVTYRSSSLIDNIYIKNKPLMDNVSFVLVEGMSDHYPCPVSYQLAMTKTQSNIKIEKRKLNDESIFKIQQDLLFHNWDPIYALSADAGYNYLSSVIKNVMNRHAPKKFITIKNDNKFHEPWLTIKI